MTRQWLYWPGLLAGVVMIIVIPWWWFCSAQTTVVLVRHADRDGSLDSLSAAGHARAAELAHVLEKATVQTIIHSEFVRTRQTAAPIATATGVTPVVIAAADVEAVATEIRNNQRGRRVLVVGHSNTVPQIIAALGGPVLPNINENEFDNLFILPSCRCRWFVAPPVHMQYGVTSP